MWNITTNHTTLEGAFGSVSNAMPEIWNLLLFFEFLIIIIGGSLYTKKQIGLTEIHLWFAVASLTILISALFLLLAGVMTMTNFIIILVFPLVFIGLYFVIKSQS